PNPGSAERRRKCRREKNVRRAGVSCEWQDVPDSRRGKNDVQGRPGNEPKRDSERRLLDGGNGRPGIQSAPDSGYLMTAMLFMRFQSLIPGLLRSEGIDRKS